MQIMRHFVLKLIGKTFNFVIYVGTSIYKDSSYRETRMEQIENESLHCYVLYG